MIKIHSRILQFVKYPIADKMDIFRILVIILEVKVIIHLFPLRYYYSKYISNEFSEPVDLQPFKNHLSRIQRIIKVMPFSITCLMRAIIIRKYLYKYNLTIPIYIGVKIESDFLAHAWLDEARDNGYFKIN